MSVKSGYKTAWLILLLITTAIVVIVFTPVWLIQPFAPQSEKALQISFLLKSWSPILTLLAGLIAIALSIFIWQTSKRWFSKVFLIVPLFLIFVLAWFARQNHFEWMFNPLAQSAFAKAGEVDFVADDDMVLAVKINGEAVAYPIRQMAYHHIVQDVVGGMPITATY